MKKKRIKDVLSMLLTATLIVSVFFGTGETVRGGERIGILDTDGEPRFI